MVAVNVVPREIVRQRAGGDRIPGVEIADLGRRNPRRARADSGRFFRRRTSLSSRDGDHDDFELGVVREIQRMVGLNHPVAVSGENVNAHAPILAAGLSRFKLLRRSSGACMLPVHAESGDWLSSGVPVLLS